MTDHPGTSPQNPAQPETPTPASPGATMLEASLCSFESFEYHPGENELRAIYDAAEISPSTAIIEAVAAVSEKDPIDLEPLYSAVDPDALDMLLSRESIHDGDVDVTFDFEAHAVSMSSYGSIVLRSAQDGNRTSQR